MSSFQKSVSGKRLTEIMTANYMEDYTKAQEGAFIIWVAIIVPVELFYGFDNVVYAVPESHAAMTAAKGLGPTQCEKSESRGYSMDLCSYPRIDMGSAFDGGKDSPIGGLPQPDLLISNNNNCTLLAKWFDVYHREWQVPHLILDVPFCYEEQKPKDLDYIVRQFRGMINTIEELSGQKFDVEKAKEAVNNAYEAGRYWNRFLRHAHHRPSGITVFDSFVQMAPLLTMRGTPELAEHYRLLDIETAEQIKNGTFPVPDEKYRLLWDNIAPWHQLRKMKQHLAELQANIVAAPYTYCIGSLEGEYDFFPQTDDDDPLRLLARTMNATVCPHGMKLRRKAMTQVIKEAQIDGVIFASNRSCKPFSLMQMDQQRHISSSCNIPAVMVDVDHADIRSYSEKNILLRIETLLEMIEARRTKI